MWGKLLFMTLACVMVIVTQGEFGSKIKERRAATATTTTAPVPTGTIHMHHNTAMIVMTNGCYQYYLSNPEIHHLKSHHGTERQDAEKKLLQAVASATEVHEVDHHVVDSLSKIIQEACEDLPIFRLNTPHH